MAFEIFNAPADFQSYINKILSKKLDIFVIVYWDYIFIYTKDLGQAQVNAIWWVFKEFRKHGLFSKFKKCWFHKCKRSTSY